MDNFAMLGIEDVLDYFDIEKTNKLIHDQLDADEFAPGGIVTDHLKPMWVRYQALKVDPEQALDSSAVEMAKQKFDNICLLFIKVVTERFGITIDIGWLENQSPETIHSIALLLYTFFVIDLESTLTEVLYCYIKDHATDLAEHFAEIMKTRKDAPYIAFKKTMTPEYAVIAANIYDICYWILDQMTEEEFMDYVSPDYVPQPHIKAMFDEGHLSGNYVDKIHDYFRKNGGLRTRICFELISLFKNNHKKIEKEDE